MEAEAFSSLLEARTLLEDWRIECNIGDRAAAQRPWLPDP
jgi:hypothetical protein